MSRPLFITCEIWRTAESISDHIRTICEKADTDHFEIAPYTEGIDSICISVNCHPDENLAAGWGKPRTSISYQKRFADFRLPLPYVAYRNADADTQYLMVVRNITESIRRMDEKCRKSKRAKVDSAALNTELLRRLDIAPERLEGITGVIPDAQYRKIVSP